MPFPDQARRSSTEPPIVYVHEKTVWEYKLIHRNPHEQDLPSEQELNRLGKDGWELVSVVSRECFLQLYFKRIKN
jgi:hypothetical protein